MGWSRVYKTINGHRYVYEQRTWREGGRVRTDGFYVGRETLGPSRLFHGSRSVIRGRPRPSENATTLLGVGYSSMGVDWSQHLLRNRQQGSVATVCFRVGGHA